MSLVNRASVRMLFALSRRGLRRGWQARCAARSSLPRVLSKPRTVEPLRFRYMGPAAGRAHRLGRRRARRSDHATMLGVGVGRRVEDRPTAAPTFAPIFDNEPVAAIGALAVAPSDPESVWAGTGEAVGHPRRRRDGRRHLQVDRRRQDVEEHGRPARRDAAASAASSSIPRTPTSCTSARSAASPDRSRSAASISTTDGGAHLAARAVRESRHRAAPVSRWTADDPEHARSPACGRSCMHTWGEFSGLGRLQGEPGSGVHITHDGGTTWTKVDDRHAEVAGRQDRRRDRAVEFASACTR